MIMMILLLHLVVGVGDVVVLWYHHRDVPNVGIRTRVEVAVVLDVDVAAMTTMAMG